MVREVEGIETERKELILERLKALLQAGVVICRTGTVEDVSIPLRRKGACSWGGEDA